MSSERREMWCRVAGAMLSVATLASLAVAGAGTANADESSYGTRAGARISVSQPSGPVYANLVTRSEVDGKSFYTPSADGMVPYVDVTVNGVQSGVEYCLGLEDSNNLTSIDNYGYRYQDCVKSSGSSVRFREYYDDYIESNDSRVKNGQLHVYPTVVKKSDFVNHKIDDPSKIVAMDTAGVIFKVLDLKNLIQMSNLKPANVSSNSADLTYDYKFDSSLQSKIADTCLATRLWRTYDIDFPNGFDGLDTRVGSTDFFAGRAGFGYDDYCGGNNNVSDDKVNPETFKIKTYQYKKNGKVRYTYRYQAWNRYWGIDFGKDLGSKLSGTVKTTLPWLNANTKYGNWNRGDDTDVNWMLTGIKLSDGELSTLIVAAEQSAKKQKHSTDPVGLLVSGLQVKFKDGSYYTPFAEMTGGTEVPTFTTKASGTDKPSTPTGLFADVTKSTPHADDIKWLASTGISTGWKEADGSTTFRGMSSVKRQDMAAFLYRLAGSPKFDESKVRNPFRDVTSKTPHYKEIMWLYSTGISTGWKMADGSFEFRGMNSVVRQDMAAFLHRLADYGKAKPTLGKDVPFKDVNGATPHSADIAWLAKTGVTTGWKEADGTTTYRGMSTVKRQDMAAFLHRMSVNVLKK